MTPAETKILIDGMKKFNDILFPACHTILEALEEYNGVIESVCDPETLEKQFDAELRANDIDPDEVFNRVEKKLIDHEKSRSTLSPDLVETVVSGITDAYRAGMQWGVNDREK